MTINKENSDENNFEPPFANSSNQEEEVPDTYQPITIDLTAQQVEYLSELLLLYISDNGDFIDNDEWVEIDQIQNLLSPGIIVHKK